MKRVLMAAVAVLTMAGCGAPITGQGPGPAAADLTERDDGRSIHLAVGDQVVVRLRRLDGFGDWSLPRTSDPTVLRGQGNGAFKGAGNGTAQVEASTAPACSPGMACAQLARLFRVTVVVGSGTPAIMALADADSGRSVRLAVGTRLEVSQHAAPGSPDWSHPASSNPGVLMPTVDPRAAAVRGATLASFLALAPGHAELLSYSGFDCSPPRMCPVRQPETPPAWRVSVDVV
jgi:hypothetical protein